MLSHGIYKALECTAQSSVTRLYEGQTFPQSGGKITDQGKKQRIKLQGEASPSHSRQTLPPHFPSYALFFRLALNTTYFQSNMDCMCHGFLCAKNSK